MFAQSFWTHDYSTGVNVLFDKLKQGLSENNQILAFVAGRIRVENTFATELTQLCRTTAPAPHHGFSRDSGGLLRRGFESYLTETSNRAILHCRVAENLEKKVRAPLEKWCKGHAKRINECESHLKSKIAGYHRLLLQVAKQRQLYYERSRQQEDAADTKFEPVASTIRIFRERYASTSHAPAAVSESFVMAGLEYNREQMAKLMALLIKDVIIQEYKVPILGPYENVSNGVNVASSIRRYLKNDSIAYAEKFGQALVDRGFLRPVGQISNKFQSSHNSYYQWQDDAFALASYIEQNRRPPTASSGELSIPRHRKRAPQKEPEESEGTRDNKPTDNTEELPNLTHEGEQYLQLVLELDLYRCEMECEIHGVYEYLERCEIDRLTALRHALTDFAMFSERPDEHRELLTRLLDAQQSIKPEKDLEYICEAYQTGPLVPSVTIFQGYSDSHCQTFGVDLKYSGYFIELVIDYIAQEQVKLENWVQPYPLSEVYKLRNQINNGRPFKPDILKFFPVSIVVGTLKQFLLELPESVLPFTIYDSIKGIYDDISNISERQTLLIGVLLHTPKPSLKALQLVIDHLMQNYPDHHDQLSDALAIYLFRPRAVSALSQLDTHPSLFIKDLLDNDQEILHSTLEKVTSLSQQRSTTPIGFVSPHRRRLSQSATKSPTTVSSASPKRDNLPSLIPLSLDPERQSELTRSRGIGVTKGLGFSNMTPSASPLKHESE